MKKIVMLTGSPHNPGASKTLADAFEKGAKEASNEVFSYDAGLQGAAEPHFLQLDNRNNGGMEVGIPDSDYFEEAVIPKLIDADIVVLVSSLYYFGINAQLKTVIDRFYNYNHRLKDKHSIVLFAGFGSQDDMSAVKMHMKILQNYMRWPSLVSIYADESWNFGKLHKFAKQAYDLGKVLA